MERMMTYLMNFSIYSLYILLIFTILSIFVLLFFLRFHKKKRNRYLNFYFDIQMRRL